MNKPKLTVLVGPPGSGKTTFRDSVCKTGTEINAYYCSQDNHGKTGHLEIFKTLISERKNIVLDRMNFNKQQRERYLAPAKAAGYETEIVVLHQNYATCLKRCNDRRGHPTIQDEKSARSALSTFFGKYERPTPDEADTVTFIYPKVTINTIVCDIDNTLSDSNHRQGFLDKPKKDWKGFFDQMHQDPVNDWCRRIINTFRHSNNATMITLCSGRPSSYMEITKKWLIDNSVYYDDLFMRDRSDSRRDDIVKEQLMDFEVLTRYNILFWIDDRKQVIDKIRSRGVLVLDCAGEKGNF